MKVFLLKKNDKSHNAENPKPPKSRMDTQPSGDVLFWSE